MLRNTFIQHGRCERIALPPTATSAMRRTWYDCLNGSESECGGNANSATCPRFVDLAHIVQFSDPSMSEKTSAILASPSERIIH